MNEIRINFLIEEKGRRKVERILPGATIWMVNRFEGGRELRPVGKGQKKKRRRSRVGGFRYYPCEFEGGMG